MSNKVAFAQITAGMRFEMPSIRPSCERRVAHDSLLANGLQTKLRLSTVT